MNILEFEEISPKRIADVFKTADIRAQPEAMSERELFLDHGLEFPLWLTIDRERKRIAFYAYLPCGDGAPLDRLPEFADSLNRRYHTVQFASYIDDGGEGRIIGLHTFHTEHGIIVEQLVDTVQTFSYVFKYALKEMDKDKVFFHCDGL